MQPTRFKSFSADKRGQVAVEAAILVPVLLILVSAIFVVGNWFNAILITNAAAREGVRNLSLTGDCDQMISGVQQAMQALDHDQNSKRTTVSVLPYPLPLSGESIEVEVKYELPDVWSWFRKYYEANSGENYVFNTVVGRASTKMETNPTNIAACSS